MWRAATAVTSGSRLPPRAVYALACICRDNSARRLPPTRRENRSVRKLRLTRALLLCQIADLVEPLAGALAQYISRFGAGLGRQQRDLSAVADAFLEHLLCIFGVLGDPVLGGSRLGEI